MVITGTGFGTTQGSSTVKFNATTATVSSWTATSLTTAVPTGATTGNVVVRVGGVNSNGVNFPVVAAPNITSLSPTTGAVGTTVTVNGTGFGTTQGDGTVTFNGVAGSPSSWTATRILVPVPSGTATGNVVVRAAGVNSNGSPFTVSPTPTITGLSAPLGMVGVVSDHWDELRRDAGHQHRPLQRHAGHPFELECHEHRHADSGGSDIRSHRGDGFGVPSAGTSFIGSYVTPTVSSLSPTSGAVGALVTINGTGFQATQGTSTVTFNGVSATPTSWNDTQIKATGPPAAAVTGDVVVTVAGAGEQPTDVHRPTHADDHERRSDVWRRGGAGDDHRHELRHLSGIEHRPLQWHDSDGACVGCHANRRTGAERGDDRSAGRAHERRGCWAGTFKVVTVNSIAISPTAYRCRETASSGSRSLRRIPTAAPRTLPPVRRGSCSSTTVGTIDSEGVFKAIGTGATDVQATFGSLTAATTVTISGQGFVPAGVSLMQVRSGHTATLLPNGKVLIAGGWGGVPGSGTDGFLHER